MPVDFNTNEWPLVFITVKGRISATEHEELLSRVAQVITTRLEPWVAIVDFTEMGPTDAKQRASHARHLDQYKEYYQRYCVGMANVAPSVVLRGVLTAVHWLTSTAYEQRVFADRESAVQWARGRLRDAARPGRGA